MGKEIFALCDPEASYVFGFMVYPIGIPLVSAKARCKELCSLPIGRTVILSEKERIPDPGFTPIYSCQSLEPMKFYAEDHTEPRPRPTEKRGTELYGIYSPIGRTGKTAFALALGEILAESKRVLYLNFEEYAGFEELFQTKYRADLTDLVCLSGGEDNLIYKFNSLVQTFHELEYIPPALFPFALREVTADEWMEFLREVMDYREYEVIILDLSGQVNGLFRILRECDKIYMPVRDDMISRAKLKQYEHLLQLLKMEEISKKTLRIRPPAQLLLKEAGDPILQLSRGEMGDYVRHILQKEEQENK